MIKRNEIISYKKLEEIERAHLQRGMNFGIKDDISVILMNKQVKEPYGYRDKFLNDGKVIIYQGHNALRRNGWPDPETIDQPMYNKNGTLTQNGLFYYAAIDYKSGKRKQPKIVRVYEKLRPKVWVYKGEFKLVDAWIEEINNRKVFKFRLELSE